MASWMCQEELQDLLQVGTGPCLVVTTSEAAEGVHTACAETPNLAFLSIAKVVLSCYTSTWGISEDP